MAAVEMDTITRGENHTGKKGAGLGQTPEEPQYLK